MNYGMKPLKNLEEYKMRYESVFLITKGDGMDGDEWQILSIHKSKEGAEAAKNKYEETWRLKIEEWELNE